MPVPTPVSAEISVNRAPGNLTGPGFVPSVKRVQCLPMFPLRRFPGGYSRYFLIVDLVPFESSSSAAGHTEIAS